MPDSAPTTSHRTDILTALSYALRYNREGRRVHERDLLAANAAAEHLLDALERSGFVILRAHAAPDHAASQAAPPREPSERPG